MHAVFLELSCTFTHECLFGRAKEMKDMSSFLEMEAHAGQALPFLDRVM
jgi:hypothetical protein